VVTIELRAHIRDAVLYHARAERSRAAITRKEGEEIERPRTLCRSRISEVGVVADFGGGEARGAGLRGGVDVGAMVSNWFLWLR